MEFQKIIEFYATILHYACRSGNIDLVKYLISLNKIDMQAKTIVYLFFF